MKSWLGEPQHGGGLRGWEDLGERGSCDVQNAGAVAGKGLEDTGATAKGGLGDVGAAAGQDLGDAGAEEGLGDAGAAAEEDLGDVGAVTGEMRRTQEPWLGRSVGSAAREDAGDGGAGGGEGLGDVGAVGLGECMGLGPGSRGAAVGPGPRLTRGCVQVGWTRVNLAKKLLEKASGVTLVLKKIPLDLPGSPPSPRQQVSNPSAHSTAPVLRAQSWASPTTLAVPKVVRDHGGMRAGPDAPSAAPRSVFRHCGSPQHQERRVPGQPRVPDLQVSPVP